jgi:flavodoxin
MKALVIYESMFGNTAEIAHAVARGLTTSAEDEVETRDVADLPHASGEGFDLVVAGGPTHAFSMTRPATREEAVKQGAPHQTTSTGLREWLAESGLGRRTQLVATFDTKVSSARHLPGSAAKSAGRVLRRQGHAEVLHPESFWVDKTPGPLLPGEIERAQAWGERLGLQTLGRLTAHEVGT